MIQSMSDAATRPEKTQENKAQASFATGAPRHTAGAFASFA